MLYIFGFYVYVTSFFIRNEEKECKRRRHERKARYRQPGISENVPSNNVIFLQFVSNHFMNVTNLNWLHMFSIGGILYVTIEMCLV